MALKSEVTSAGLFSLQDQHGPDLGVLVSKEGYYPRRGGAKYGPIENRDFTPDPRNPVVFILRKKGKSETLIERDFPPGIGQYVQLRHDGTPVEVNLFKSEKVAPGTGQLKLELWRSKPEKVNAHFEWKCQLTVPGGGLLKTDEEFAFEAPSEGYQPSFVIEMPATNQAWQDNITTKFYVRLPDGKFGRIDFYLLAYNGVFTVHSTINPSGSRNLEPAN